MVTAEPEALPVGELETSTVWQGTHCALAQSLPRVYRAAQSCQAAKPPSSLRRGEAQGLSSRLGPGAVVVVVVGGGGSDDAAGPLDGQRVELLDHRPRGLVRDLGEDGVVARPVRGQGSGVTGRGSGVRGRGRGVGGRESGARGWGPGWGLWGPYTWVTQGLFARTSAWLRSRRRRTRARLCR